MPNLEFAPPTHVDESEVVDHYADVLTGVAASQQAVIVRRGGADLAAVVPMRYLELMEDAVLQRKIEQLSASIDWKRAAISSPPPQAWFDGDEPKPF